MAIRFDASTDQLVTDGWGGTVASILCWIRIETDRNDSSDPWIVTASAGGAGSTRALLGTDASGTQMDLYDSAFDPMTGPAMVVGTWYATAAVMNGTSWTFYYGTNPAALSSVSETQNQVSAPGSLVLSLSAEWFHGDIANLKVFTRALSASDVAAELATYDVVDATSLIRKHSFRTTSLANEQGSGSAFTAGSTAVSQVAGPTALADVTGALAGTVPMPTGPLAADIGLTGALAGTVPMPSGDMAAVLGIGGQLAGTLPMPVGTLAEVMPLTSRPRVGVAELETVTSGWRVGAVT